MQKEQRPANSSYTQVAVQWLNQSSCFYQHLCWVGSEVLRNPLTAVSGKPLYVILRMTQEKENE